METNKQELLNVLLESKEYCEKVNYDLTKLHCNKCANHCLLVAYQCERGEKTYNLLKNTWNS